MATGIANIIVPSPVSSGIGTVVSTGIANIIVPSPVSSGIGTVASTGIAAITTGLPTVYAYDSVTSLGGWFSYGWFTSPWFGTYPQGYTFPQASSSYITPASLVVSAVGDRESLRYAGKDIIMISGCRFYRKIGGAVLRSTNP